MCNNCLACDNACKVEKQVSFLDTMGSMPASNQPFGIKYIDYYIPEKKLEIDRLVEQISQEAIPKNFSSRSEYKEFANTILELSSIKVESERTESEMLVALLTKMFGSEDVDPLSIDLIMLVDERRNQPQDNLAQFLQFHFGMNNSFVLNVSGNHCANLDVALSTASKLNSDQINNILILNSTRIAEMNDRIIGSYGILGDAAGIMLLSKGKEVSLKIIDSCVLNNGRLHQVDMGKDNSLLHSKYILSSLKKVLSKQRVQLADIRKILVQNANPLLNAYVLNNAGISTDKMFKDNFGRHGHLDSLDFLVNLKDISESKELNNGDMVLSLGMGWAGSYASILFTKN